jgi:8-oxo-dGTP pyrophosphatase MutT (NUDIX family)
MLAVGNPTDLDYPPMRMLGLLEKSFIQRPGQLAEGHEGSRQAAVAVIVRPNHGVLFIRRAENERDPWSGHMALPGGRVDPGDATAEAAARREVLEEVGVKLGYARKLGMLDQLVSPPMTPPLIVSAFVYVVEHDPPVVLDPKEVASVHWFGLDRLIGGEGRGEFLYKHGDHELVLPRVDLDGNRIWGMTLRLVDDLVGRIQHGG